MSDLLEYMSAAPRVYELVPEVPVYAGPDDEVKALHRRLFEEKGVSWGDPPFWAFVWPGGQALARWTLDNREYIQDKRILEIGPGTGINAIAASIAGAKLVRSFDVEQRSIELSEINASTNRRSNIEFLSERAYDYDIDTVDMILMGDCFYDGIAAHELGELADYANQVGKPFIIGDPKREYTPLRRCKKLASYTVPDTFKLERNFSTPAFVYEVGPS